MLFRMRFGLRIADGSLRVDLTQPSATPTELRDHPYSYGIEAHNSTS
jgi:hypothetical protein